MKQDVLKLILKCSLYSPSPVFSADCVGHHGVLSGSGNCLSYGTFDEMECPDASKCGDVAFSVQRELRAAQDAKLQSQLMLPKDLIGRLTHDVISMAQCEPCGVRGCVMYLNIERKGTSVPLGGVTFEPNCVATFELDLTLIEEKTAWSGFLRLLRTVFMPCSGPRYRSKIFISPGYRIVKKKLYKSS